MTPATKDIARLSVLDALRAVDGILHCNGWREALEDDNPGNVTQWAGPRLYAIRDNLKIISAFLHDDEGAP